MTIEISKFYGSLNIEPQQPWLTLATYARKPNVLGSSRLLAMCRREFSSVIARLMFVSVKQAEVVESF